MLFPFRTRSIFRSRWIALLWAVGIIWMAVDVAGSVHQDAGGNNSMTTSDDNDAAADADQLKQAAKLLEQLER